MNLFPLLIILLWMKKPEQIKKKGTADSKTNSITCGYSVPNSVPTCIPMTRNAMNIFVLSIAL